MNLSPSCKKRLRHTRTSPVQLVKWDEQPEVAPDFAVKIRPEAFYDGSGWNYLITFPGFLLFTHAWNGFVYKADVVTTLDLQPTGGTATNSELRTTYDLRYCDFDRGAVTSTGWYTPGWGGLNLFIGFYMIGYDTDATPEFQKEVRYAYGQFIANSIVEMANAVLPEAQSSTFPGYVCATLEPQTRHFRPGCT